MNQSLEETLQYYYLIWLQPYLFNFKIWVYPFNVHSQWHKLYDSLWQLQLLEPEVRKCDRFESAHWKRDQFWSIQNFIMDCNKKDLIIGKLSRSIERWNRTLKHTVLSLADREMKQNLKNAPSLVLNPSRVKTMTKRNAYTIVRGKSRSGWLALLVGKFAIIHVKRLHASWRRTQDYLHTHTHTHTHARATMGGERAPDSQHETNRPTS